MKLRTTFHGDDLLFEGDLPLSLRALPAGAVVERATLTLVPAVATPPSDTERFFEEVDIRDGVGAFGIATQSDADGTVLDLNARRTVHMIGFGAAVTNLRVQADFGGTWVQLDKNGQPIQPDTPVDDRTFATKEDTAKKTHAVTLPNLVSQRFRISNAATSVTLVTYPSNLTLRLGDLGPFWFRQGDLRGPVTTPDFGAILQAYLERTELEGGAFDVPFILHSDALARLRLDLTVDFHIEQSLLPPGLSKAVYPFGYSTVPTSQPALLRASLPLNAQVLPKATSAQVAGRFEGTRVVHGPVSATTVRDTLPVTPAQSAANPIVLPQAVRVSAIDVNLETVTPAARLLIALQEDIGGKPWGPSLLPAPIEVRTERPAAGGSTWVNAPLPVEFTFHQGETYWLIVNAVEGEMRWALDPAGDLPPLQVTRDAALSWRVHTSDVLGGAVAGIYRLRAQLTAFRQPVKLDVAGREVSLHKLDALGKVDFTLDLPEMAAAMNAAIADTALQQAALSERVANGDFSRWTRIKRRSGRIVAAPIGLRDQGIGVLLASPSGVDVFAVTHGTTNVSGQVQPTFAVQPVRNAAQPAVLAPAQLTSPLATYDSLSVVGADVSPDGKTVYLAAQPNVSILQPSPQQRGGGGGDENSGLYVWRFDVNTRTFQHIAKGRVQLPQPLMHVLVAADPNCRFVYLAAMSDDIDVCPPGLRPVFARLDASNQQEAEIGASVNGPDVTQEIWLPPDEVEFPGQPMALLVTPDGGRAYVIEALNVHVLDPLGETIRYLGQTRFTSPKSHDGKSMQGAALSPDGTRLYLLVRQRGSGDGQGDSGLATEPPSKLLVVDTMLLERVVVGKIRADDAILLESDLDLSGPMLFPNLISESESWFPTAITPDGTRLVIADHKGECLALVDTVTGEQVETVALPGTPVALAVTPDSRRAFALTSGDENRPLGDENRPPEIHTVELDAWSADAWALTAGRVSPASAREAAQPIARLGSPTDDTGLSQLVRVQGGQPYELTFRACASAEGATAELFWLSEGCGLAGKHVAEIQLQACGGALLHHIVRASAPADATVAEVRFRQPAGGYTLLDDVSLRAPNSASVNADFEKMRVKDVATGEITELPIGWTIGPNRNALSFSDGGVILAAPASGPAMLSQQVSVTPEQPFMLQLRAWPYGRPSPNGNAYVELRWRGAEGADVNRELSACGFDVFTLQGLVPAAATSADLTVTQPAEGKLRIERVLLSQPRSATVPLTFLSEAPGELNVIAPVVAFDVAEGASSIPVPVNAPAPMPIGCKPTPPDGEPRPPNDGNGGAGGGGYCPCCEGHYPLNDILPCESETGMPCQSGTCANCEADVTMYLS